VSIIYKWFIQKNKYDTKKVYKTNEYISSFKYKEGYSITQRVAFISHDIVYNDVYDLGVLGMFMGVRSLRIDSLGFVSDSLQ
jgi:hypothetical protein